MNMVEPRQFAGLRGKLALDSPLAPHTTWRGGGHADAAYVRADRDDLALGLPRRPFVARTQADYTIGYRSVKRADGRPADGIYTAAWFRFPAGDGDAARVRIRELLGRRIATQPLNVPNAGSVFRNPPHDHAARLIEDAGLKGFAVGGAHVS